MHARARVHSHTQSSSQVDGPGIERGIQTLREGGAPPRFVIIDDGWQDTSDLPGSHLPAAPPASPRAGVLAAVRPLQIARQLAVGVRSACDRAAGALLKALSGYHDSSVALAPHSSRHIALWRFLSRVLLGPAILADYARQYDFAKRLRSLRAGPRFLGSLRGARDGEAGRAGAADAAFGDLVAGLKLNYGVHLVYCWHALTGYWSGVHPNVGAGKDASLDDLEISVEFPIPTGGALQVEPRLSWDALTLKGLGVCAPRKLDAFYQRLHDYLRACNVDGVKVHLLCDALDAIRGHLC